MRIVSCRILRREASRRKILPVTQDTDQDLTDNDTDNFHIVNGLNPSLIANLVGFPTSRKGGLEEGFDVADGEEHVTARCLLAYVVISAGPTLRKSAGSSIAHPSRPRPAPGITMLRM